METERKENINESNYKSLLRFIFTAGISFAIGGIVAYFGKIIWGPYLYTITGLHYYFEFNYEYLDFIPFIVWGAVGGLGLGIAAKKDKKLHMLLGEKYVFLQENRLARIIFEQNAPDVKTMHMRESWSLGNGYKITANSIGVPLRGEEQAWIAFFEDNIIIEDKVLPNNSLYSYLGTANGAPVLVTYTSNIYRLPQEDVADFKYTWLRSQNTTEIKEGDVFGIMEVTSVKNGIIELRNKEPIDLAPGAVINLMGDISIQVGDSKTDLLFYPTKNKL